MDIDTTVTALPLTESDIKRIITEICQISVEDNVNFQITYTETIMDDFEYPGIRVHLEAYLERIKQQIKIDVSTDDVITPAAIEYEYKLLFENRSIRLNSYNIETLLAEKAQTIIERGLANTRMRDFYDIYELVLNKEFLWETANEAFVATCQRRKTEFTKEKIEEVLGNISSSAALNDLWDKFKEKNYFVEDLKYENLIQNVCDNIRKIAGIDKK